MRRVIAILTVLASAALGAPASATTTANVHLVDQAAFTGATEIAWDGDQIYVGELNGTTGRDQVPDKGGIRIFDTADDAGTAQLVPTGFVKCPGSDNDVVVVEPGLIAFAFHRNKCHKGYARTGATNNGIALADVSDPAAPVILGSVGVASGHTLTPLPGTDYIYVHPGGLAVGGGVTSIVDVSNPAAPKVAATFTPSAAGCHDLQFLRTATRSLAFCASGAAGEVQTWDVSDPLKPTIVGRIVNPAIQFPHNALPSPDGKLLVINDEAFAAHECATGSSIAGSLWVYDITDPTMPLLAGRVAPPVAPGASAPVNAAGGTEKWCTAHNYNFVPGTRTLVSAWFTGGTTVEDLTNPLTPVRVAQYQPEGVDAYTAHWYAGRIYIADMKRGLEAITVDGIAEKPAATPDPEATAPVTLVDRTAALIPAGYAPPVRPAPLDEIIGGFLCTIPDRA